jgi:hypothetical protein
MTGTGYRWGLDESWANRIWRNSRMRDVVGLRASGEPAII